jgi:hypothetical protein
MGFLMGLYAQAILLKAGDKIPRDTRRALELMELAAKAGCGLAEKKLAEWKQTSHGDIATETV